MRPEHIGIFTDRFSLKEPIGATGHCGSVDLTRLVSLGSCFARNIDRWLRHKRLLEARHEYPWEIFYNPFSITGEIRRLFCSAPTPPPLSWIEDDSRVEYIDPWRSWITAESAAALVERNAAADLSARKYIGAPSAVLLTLGLSEIWFEVKVPDIVLNQVPLRAIRINRDRFASRFAGVEEVRRLLDSAVEGIGAEFGEELQIILTLSPVPLKYTASNLSVHVANSLSKSILRVAIHEVCKHHENVSYFPAFEAVHLMGLTREQVWQRDGRHVTAWVVEEIAMLFLGQYGQAPVAPTDALFWVPYVNESGQVIGKLYTDGSVDVDN